MRIAAIDIGTVTSRLFVADVDEAGVAVVRRESAITNLGEGVDATGVLSDEAIERTVAQVASYKAAIDEASSERAVDRVVALATSASRDARNASVFVDRLREVGVELTVIPGSREAELSFLGASFDFRDENLLFADIGGGSTELVFGRAETDGEALVPRVGLAAAHSFNVGVRRMTERFLAGDPPTEGQMAEARAWARNELAPFFGQGLTCERLVAVAGTPTSVVAVRDALVPYDPRRVHGARVSRAQLEAVAERMCAMPLGERMKVKGLQPKRAGVFPAGLVILGVVMELAGIEEFTVSESDILMGIVLDAARA